MLMFATALVRWWTRLYTWRLDPALRDRRRTEIESELWECQADANQTGRRARSVSVHILARVIIGIPDDLFWRLEQMRASGTPRSTSIWVSASAGAVMAAAIWLLFSSPVITLPQPPPNPLHLYNTAPPPPPLPPPPPPPASRPSYRSEKVIR